MSKEQIEEMRKDIFAAFGGYAKWEEDWQSLAQALYNAGYRKQSEGEWKWISDDDCICSACGKVFYSADNADAGTVLWKFCPNCGAKMKGGEEG